MNNKDIDNIVDNLNVVIKELENKIKVYDKEAQKLKLEKPPAGLPSNLRTNQSILKWSDSLRN